MIYALLLGREGSVGFPGKNVMPILGRPLMVYPLLAALNSKYIDKVFVSTDSPKIKEIALQNSAVVIDRPPELCTKEALGEDAYLHGYNWIKKNVSKDIELMVLLFCNAATLLASEIDYGIEKLRKNPDYDSAVTVSAYNMWSPLRARRENKDGLLEPFVPFETFGDLKTLNCDRDSQGDVWFADVAISVVRPRNLDNLQNGLLPQKWMGQQICPIKHWGGCDIDYEWQVPQVEYWLKKHGWTENKTPYIK
jgi:hypothetical protein